MFKYQNTLLKTFVIISDLMITATAFAFAFWLRFYAGIFSPVNAPELMPYPVVLGFVLPLWLALFSSVKLYKSRRNDSVFAAAPLFSSIALGVVFIVEKFNVNQVIITLPIQAIRKTSNIVQICERESLATDIVPDFFKFIQPRTHVQNFAGQPLVSVRFTPADSFSYRILKRIFDVVFSCVALLLSMPFLLLIALGVKLTSRGPIFFEQERIGTNRRPFRMLKFRTMAAGSEKFDKQAGLGMRNDPRVTPLGRFLRYWSLDELPQFWNVLRGDMSIVGPRPERTFYVRQFKGKIPNYMIRHKVKTGITGWAQVNGWRGDTSITKRVEHDLFYIENWSFWFDLKIIMMTVWRGMANGMRDH